MAVDFVGLQTAAQHLNRIFQLNNHDFSESPTFKQAVTVLNRSGHARFRRGPHAPSVSSVEELKKSVTETTATATETASVQSMTSSFVGGSVDGSVSNGRSLGIVAPAPSFSSRKPPLPSSHRKRNRTKMMASASLQGSGKEKHSVSGTACHCCKTRKTGSKREVRRIPTIGSKVESIPADDYSWRKYGEEKVHGSPFPRVYYKCNSVQGCPARKRIELALTDSKILIVTYDREHRH